MSVSALRAAGGTLSWVVPPWRSPSTSTTLKPCGLRVPAALTVSFGESVARCARAEPGSAASVSTAIAPADMTLFMADFLSVETPSQRPR